MNIWKYILKLFCEHLTVSNNERDYKSVCMCETWRDPNCQHSKWFIRYCQLINYVINAPQGRLTCDEGNSEYDRVIPFVGTDGGIKPRGAWGIICNDSLFLKMANFFSCRRIKTDQNYLHVQWKLTIKTTNGTSVKWS